MSIALVWLWLWGGLMSARFLDCTDPSAIVIIIIWPVLIPIMAMMSLLNGAKF